MPGYKTHLLVGGILLLSLIMIELPSLKIILALLAITITYSLLPDLDEGKSKLGRFVRTGLSLLLLILILLNLYFNFLVHAIVVAIILFMVLILRHRKFMHTIRGGVLFSLPLILINIEFFIFGFAIYFLHLFFDKSVKL
ncbi:MAG: metal-dependent hydrolase [Nanobdellota archaeon]